MKSYIGKNDDEEIEMICGKSINTKYDSQAINSSEKIRKRKIFKIISEDSNSTSEDSQNDYESASWLSKMLFLFTSKIIEKANQGKLYLKSIAKTDSPEKLIKEKNDFQIEINKLSSNDSNKSLGSFIIWRSIRQLSVCIILSCICMLLNFSTPFLIEVVYTGVVKKTIDHATVISIIIEYLIVQIICYIVIGQVNRMKRCIGTCTQNIIIILINEKCMKISKSIHKEYTKSRILSLLSSESKKISFLIYNIPSTCSSILQLSISYIMLFSCFGIGFISGIFSTTACIVCEIFIGNIIKELQGSFSNNKDNKVKLLEDKEKNKEILMWSLFTEQYSLDSLMKSMLTSFESIMRFVAFYFLIKIQGREITIQQAMLGIYLLLILQRASRTLTEIVKQHCDFEEACLQITRFLSLDEIDFDTVEINDNSSKSNKYNNAASLLWEEQSVKLGNDILFQDDESEFNCNNLNTIKITFSEENNYAKAYENSNSGKDSNDNENDNNQINGSIIIENASFSWGLPSTEEIRIENDKSFYKSKKKIPNQFPKLF